MSGGDLTPKEVQILSDLAVALTDEVIEIALPQESPGEVRRTLRGIVKRHGKPALPSQPVNTGCDTIPVKSGVYILHTDGASRGNPGEAGAGACIFDHQGNEVFADRKYLGQCTNNVAEYQALILGLHGAALLNIRKLDIRLDSELIVRQLEGRYQVKNANLKPMYQEVKSLMGSFDHCHVTHVPRAQNKRADELANQAIDGN